MSQHEEIEISVGSTVQLRSGGPIMTVAQLFGPIAASCVYYHNDTFHTVKLPIEALAPVETPTAAKATFASQARHGPAPVTNARGVPIRFGQQDALFEEG